MIKPVEQGHKIGIHANKSTPQLFDHVREAVERGVPFGLVKMTQDLTNLRTIGEISPSTITMGRVINPMDGLEGVGDITDEEVDEWADAALVPFFEFADNNPGFEEWIDIIELFNEPDPPGVQGYLMLGKVMEACVRKASERFPNVYYAVGGFNAGTPEYEEMEAFVESGIFEHENVILSLHEGVLEEGDPINKWHSSESDHPDAGLIPGAPSVPEHGGALIGRVAYWHQILGDEHMPYVVISEAYYRAYNDTEELVLRAAWVDGQYASLWYVLNSTPFTHSPTEQWKKQDYTPAYPALIDYGENVADRQNALPPQEEPDEPDPPDPPDPPPPPPPEETLQEWAWRRSRETSNPQPTFGLHTALREAGYRPFGNEFSGAHNGQPYTLQTGFSLDWQERVVAVAPAPWSGQVEIVKEPTEEPQPFTWRAWPTNHRHVTQTVGNNVPYYGKLSPHFEGHEGCDVRAPLGEPVYAVNSGIVSDMRRAGDDDHPYGRFVRVLYDDGVHEVTYSHLQKILVELGQRVQAGQEIALADNTGNIVSGGSHLHVTLKIDGVIVDPTRFILPWNPSFPGLPPAEHGATLTDVAAHQNPKGPDRNPNAPVDFEAMMRRGVQGCYIRGSIGGAGMDTGFVYNWPAIQSTVMKRGIYHLYKSNSTPRQNLDNLIRVVRKHGHGQLRLGIDVEPVGGIRVNGSAVSVFFDLFRDTFGYDPLVYTGTWILHPNHSYGDMSWMGRELLWLARYLSAPPQVGQFPDLPEGGNLDRLLMHQWTSSHHDGRRWGVASIGLDINVAYNMERLLVGEREPEPPPPPPPQGKLIDLTRFKVAHPDAWRVVKHVDNQGHETNEDVQDMQLGNGLFVRRKNRNAEWHRRDDQFFYLVHDTSPDVGSEGIPRVYTLYKDAQVGAPKSKVEQRVNEVWREEGEHMVQFRSRDGCRPLKENSGTAQNSSVIVRYEENYTFNRFGQELTFDEVIFEKTGSELQIYGRKDGKSCGWIGWQSPWASAEIVELHWDRGRLAQEPDRVCDWE